MGNPIWKRNKPTDDFIDDDLKKKKIKHMEWIKDLVEGTVKSYGGLPETIKSFNGAV